MKSALELAMEKSDTMVDGDAARLTPEQVGAIDEIKKQYEARWAEQEIVLQGKMAKMAQDVDPQTFAEHQRQFEAEIKQVRERIFEERDEKIARIRSQPFASFAKRRNSWKRTSIPSWVQSGMSVHPLSSRPQPYFSTTNGWVRWICRSPAVAVRRYR